MLPHSTWKKFRVKHDQYDGWDSVTIVESPLACPLSGDDKSTSDSIDFLRAVLKCCDFLIPDRPLHLVRAEQ